MVAAYRGPIVYVWSLLHTHTLWKSGGGLPSRPVLVIDHLLDLLVGLSVFLGDVLLTKCRWVQELRHERRLQWRERDRQRAVAK